VFSDWRLARGPAWRAGDAGSSQGCSARLVRCRGRSCRVPVPGGSRALNAATSSGWVNRWDAVAGWATRTELSGGVQVSLVGLFWLAIDRSEERSQVVRLRVQRRRLGGNGFKGRRDSSAHAGCPCLHVLSQGFNSKTWYGCTDVSRRASGCSRPPAGIGDGFGAPWDTTLREFSQMSHSHLGRPLRALFQWPAQRCRGFRDRPMPAIR
jgi:hypothetical protein